MSGKNSCIFFNAESAPLLTIFIPIASPVVAENLIYNCLPTTPLSICSSRANLDVESNASFKRFLFAVFFIQSDASTARPVVRNSTTKSKKKKSFFLLI